MHTKFCIGICTGKRHFGRPRFRWEDVTMDLKGFHVTQDRNQWQSLANMVMDLRVP
jgi:hypothetical protein